MGALKDNSKILDIGCGPAKEEKAWGIDIFPYPGVDQVQNLNDEKWKLDDNQFETVYANSVIEHVDSIPAFMNEIHRVSQHGAMIHILTPHFSSIDSYTDPTHKWHLASEWHRIVTHSYLESQMETFAHVKTEITFGKSILNLLTRLIIKIRGVQWWEKKLSFILRARNIRTTLKVIKE